MNRTILGLLVILGPASLLGTSQARAQAGVGSLLREPANGLALTPCEERPQILCGTLEVPEDPARPDGRRIALSVVVVPAAEGRPGTAPLYHLEGGPGIAATTAAPFYLGPGRAFRRHRDVVLVDQRGTGHSHPLRCPAIEGHGPLDDLYPLAEVQACRRALEGRADLTKYGTAFAADDLDRVRAALGHERIDLWALSYGTQLAQVYMDRHPGRVRRAVLVGTAPLDFRAPLHHARNAQRVLDRLFADCRADPACHAAYPDLEANWARILMRLEAGSVRVERVDPETGERTTVEIPRDRFGEAFRNVLTTTAGQRRVPALITRLADGDFGMFAEGGAPPGLYAEGMYLSNVCSEGTARIRPEDVAPAVAGTFGGDYRVRQQMDACARWPTVDIPEEFYEPVRADAPVLMVAGEMDHVTPPAYAERVCAELRSCTLVRIPEMGHVPVPTGWTGGECVLETMVRFYEAEDPSEVDTSCVGEMLPPPFEAPTGSAR